MKCFSQHATERRAGRGPALLECELSPVNSVHRQRRSRTRGLMGRLDHSVKIFVTEEETQRA